LKNYLIEIFNKTKTKLEYLNNIELFFSTPNSKEHGDYSTNAALMLTKVLKKNPRVIAEEIIANLEYDSNIIEKIEIANPGFINFYFTNNFLYNIINKAITKNLDFGKSSKYNGKTAQVEFVSANPTGPLTVGHGRNSVYGDTVANLLEWVGYEVHREYYFNNAGRQMRVLGDSVKFRYMQLCGKNVDFPDDHYQGEYIKEIAASLFEKHKDSLLSDDNTTIYKDTAEAEIFKDIKKTLKRIDIEFQSFYNEQSLYKEGRIEGLLKTFEEKGLSYKKDDALWLKLTELGNEQDKVIVKSTGEPTYRLPDIAYHVTKFERNYDLIIDIFGSDHNATYPDVMAALKSMGYSTEKIKVLIHQFVTITKDGEIVKMSTRKANYITLDELIDEVGADVVRYFFNMRGITTHLNFDIELAKKQSDENPVFYLQYAHARIASIIRMAEQQELFISLENLNLLDNDEEINLLQLLNVFEDEVLLTAETYESQRIANYLTDLATAFHKFYTFCRIIGSDKNVAQARLALIKAVQIAIRNGLSILGVSSPDKM